MLSSSEHDIYFIYDLNGLNYVNYAYVKVTNCNASQTFKQKNFTCLWEHKAFFFY